MLLVFDIQGQLITILKLAAALLSVAVISLVVVAALYNVESSAYIDTQALLSASGRSLEKEKKSYGPRKLLWGITDNLVDVREASNKKNRR